MIRAHRLHEVLAGRVGDGVRCAMVVDHDGALLGSAHAEEGAPVNEQQMIGAVTSHIWCTYEEAGREAGPLQGQALNTLLIDLQAARVVAAPAGTKHLVCVVGELNAETGLLITKATALATYLRDCLRQVASLTAP